MDYSKKKEEIEKKFNDLKAKVIETANVQKAWQEEMLKLQGEFRALDEMEKEGSKETEKSKKTASA